MMRFMTCLLSMSLQAVLIIGVVFAVRKLFSMLHISKKYAMLLWMIAFFFLIFPWKVTVSRGFWHQAAAGFGIEIGGVTTSYTEMDRKTPEGKAAINPQLEKTANQEAFKMETGVDTDSLKDGEAAINAGHENARTFLDMLASLGEGRWRQIFRLLCGIWAFGILCFLLYGVRSYWRLKKNVLCSIHWNANASLDGIPGSCVYCTDGIQVPVTLGYLKPRIYLPVGIEEAYAEYAIAHESTHIARKDPVKKAAAYFITCLHWPNPIVWLAYYFMAKDMEMACDEETVARIGVDRRKGYAAALLQLSVGKGNVFAIPPAFGEGDVRERIKNIIHYQKTMKTSAAMAVAAGLFIAGIFLTADQKDPAGQVSAQITGQPDVSAQGNAQSAGQKDPTGNANSKTANGTPTELGKDKLTFAMLREAFAEKTVSGLDFHSYANGEKEDPGSDALNYNILFTFLYEEEDYRLQISYNKETGLLEDIYIVRLSDSEYGRIYTNRDGQEAYPNDLEVYLNSKIAIEDWLTLELPEGYTLGAYHADVGYVGGALISPQVYQPQIDTFTPAHWMYAGFVGRVIVANPEPIFLFENGKLDERSFPLSNHSYEKAVGVLDTALADTGWQTLMVHGFHDLYTAPELYELESGGTDIDSLETESEYWYFYFVREGEEDAYVLSLSAKEFTKKEAIKIAKTVKMAEGGAAQNRK